MTKVAALFLAAGVFAQPGFCQHAVAPPQLGFIADGSRALRPVYGLAGNFILGRSMQGSVVSQAFSGSLGLLKTAASLAAFNPQGEALGSADVSAGPALFAFSPGGTIALAYIASTNSLIEWRAGVFSRVPFHPVDGTVLAIAFPVPSEATFIVQRDTDGIWEMHIPLDTFAMPAGRWLAGVRAPVLALPSGDLVYADASGIVVRHAFGSETRVPASLPASFSLQQMDPDWVELTDVNSHARFAIRTAASHEGFYRLPE